MTELGVERPQDEDLVAITETDACGVDAIQEVTNCTAEKGNLISHLTREKLLGGSVLSESISFIVEYAARYCRPLHECRGTGKSDISAPSGF